MFISDVKRGWSAAAAAAEWVGGQRSGLNLLTLEHCMMCGDHLHKRHRVEHCAHVHMCYQVVCEPLAQRFVQQAPPLSLGCCCEGAAHRGKGPLNGPPAGACCPPRAPCCCRCCCCCWGGACCCCGRGGGWCC
jgi:hypothetical protein